MHNERESGNRWVYASLVLLIGGCRTEAGASDTDTDTDTDVTTGVTVGLDTDTDTDTDAEPPPVTTMLSVEVSFANDRMRTITNSLHVWVLRPDVGSDIDCSDLVSDEIDPYDFGLVRLGDGVNTTVSEPSTFPAVEVGEGLVYVEGVTVTGQAELAGCAAATLTAPATSVTIALGLARTFDCSDPATEDGAPCDDGEFCTVGETCRDGSCRGASARDCSVLADQCNAASCTEEDGCVVAPVPDDTTCNDGFACTLGDSCQEGICVGTLRDCAAEAVVCQQSAGCLEPTGECLFVDADESEPCDDGLFCTENTVCIAGSCLGTDVVCPGDDCNEGVCLEDEDSCGTVFADTETVCSDDANECTEASGLCDGAGSCEAAEANEGMTCNEGAGICTSGVCI